jgi:hypothetical protein
MDFSDFGWLADVANKRAVQDGRTALPAAALKNLLSRGLIEQRGVQVSLTRRGEIAMAKLG